MQSSGPLPSLIIIIISHAHIRLFILFLLIEATFRGISHAYQSNPEGKHDSPSFFGVSDMQMNQLYLLWVTSCYMHLYKHFIGWDC